MDVTEYQFDDEEIKKLRRDYELIRKEYLKRGKIIQKLKSMLGRGDVTLDVQKTHTPENQNSLSKRVTIDPDITYLVDIRLDGRGESRGITLSCSLSVESIVHDVKNDEYTVNMGCEPLTKEDIK